MSYQLHKTKTICW